MTDASMPAHRRRWFRWPVLLLSLAAASSLVWRGRDDLELLADVGPLTVAGLVLSSAAYLLSQSERLRLLVQREGSVPISFVPWTRLFVVGRLLNNLGWQTGNVYRAVAMKGAYGTSVTSYLSGVTGHTWLSITTSLFIASLFSLLAEKNTTTAPRSLAATLVGATVVAAAGPFVMRFLITRAPGRIRSWRATHMVEGILASATSISRNPRLAVLLAMSLGAGFAAGAAVLALAYLGAGEHLSIGEAGAMLAFLQAVNVVALTPGNLGVQELGFAGLSTVFGHSPASGVVASGLVRLAGLVAVLVIWALTEVSAPRAESARHE